MLFKTFRRGDEIYIPKVLGQEYWVKLIKFEPSSTRPRWTAYFKNKSKDDWSESLVSFNADTLLRWKEQKDLFVIKRRPIDNSSLFI